MMAIKVSNLSKNFKLYASSGKRLLEYMSLGRLNRHTDFWALRDISFEVPKGTTVGIVGQNGSGKSTLLSILAGVLEPSGGSFEVNGKVSAILELGSGFHPEFTGKDNVYMYASIMGLSTEEIDQKYDEILHFSELGDFIDQPLRTYSSGMIVRLAFSVAVNVNSDILIVDEALAVGDAIFQHRCFRKIREMQESGKTILYVGHDTEVVRNLCSYAMLLDGGRIIERGDANMVVNKYHALIAERERMYNEGNLEERGEVLKDGYDLVYNFVDNLKNARIKCQHSDHVRELVLEIRSTPRKVIFAHPTSEIGYDLKVEPDSSLAFAIGILPDAWDKIKYGVRFDINIICEGLEKNIFTKGLEPKKDQHEKGWHNFIIGLEEYSGKEVTIKFITSVSGEDLSYCWAAWGWPKMVHASKKIWNNTGDTNNKLDELENMLGYSNKEERFGNKMAEIIKVEIFDKNGLPKLLFQSGDMALFRIHVITHKDFDESLTVGCTIKNKFTDVYGTNTKWEGVDLHKKKKGEVSIIKFTQPLKLAAGIYSLNAGVVIVRSDRDIEVLDRRYDCLLFRIDRNKKMVGIADLGAKVEICN